MKYIIRPCARSVDDCVAYVKTREAENLSNEDYYDDETDTIYLQHSKGELLKTVVLGEKNGEIIGLFEPIDLEGTCKRKH